VDLERILTAAHSPTNPSKRGTHSALYRWFWEHYSALKPALTSPPSPNWEAVTEELQALGGATSDGSGNPPSVATVRKTWWRVCRDREVLAMEGPKRITRRRDPADIRPDGGATKGKPDPFAFDPYDTGPIAPLPAKPSPDTLDDEVVPTPQNRFPSAKLRNWTYPKRNPT
jgi:hypothetical protein